MSAALWDPFSWAGSRTAPEASTTASTRSPALWCWRPSSRWPACRRRAAGLRLSVRRRPPRNSPPTLQQEHSEFRRPTTPSAATRRSDFPPDGQTIECSDFGCCQPLKPSDLGIDLRHDLPRYSCCLLCWRSISKGNGADQGQERVTQSGGIAQHVALRFAMDVHQHGFDRCQLSRHCLRLRGEIVLAAFRSPGQHRKPVLQPADTIDCRVDLAERGSQFPQQLELLAV